MRLEFALAERTRCWSIVGVCGLRSEAEGCAYDHTCALKSGAMTIDHCTELFDGFLSRIYFVTPVVLFFDCFVLVYVLFMLL